MTVGLDGDVSVGVSAGVTHAATIEVGVEYEDGGWRTLRGITNELAYNLSRPVRNNLVCCYWVEWILEFEARCKKRKESCTCERRTWAPCGDKHQTDPVWVIWDAILQEAGRRSDPLLVKIVGALLEIFCIRYGPGVKKRRRFVIYNAIALLTEEVQMGIPIMSNEAISAACARSPKMHTDGSSPYLCSRK